MIGNKSNIFLGCSKYIYLQKKQGKLLQQNSTRIDLVFLQLLVDTSINRKFQSDILRNKPYRGVKRSLKDEMIYAVAIASTKQQQHIY